MTYLEGSIPEGKVIGAGVVEAMPGVMFRDPGWKATPVVVVIHWNRRKTWLSNENITMGYCK